MMIIGTIRRGQHMRLSKSNRKNKFKKNEPNGNKNNENTEYPESEKQSTADKKHGAVLTVPNLLSFARLLMIPLMIWMYVKKQKYRTTAVVLLLSGATDVVDGFIARRFNMVSDLGKALDPVADKLTQIAVLLCLLSRFRLLIVPCILLIIKETVTGAMGLAVIRHTGVVHSARWHGKLTTVSIYILMLLHMLWYDIPQSCSIIAVTLCIAVMCLSFTLYFINNLKALKNKEGV